MPATTLRNNSTTSLILNWIRLTCVLCLHLLFIPTVKAQYSDPFPLVDENPFIRIFGIPKPTSTTPSDVNKFDIRTSLSINNSSIHDVRGNEEIIWDGETSILNIDFQFGFTRHLSLGMNIPMVSHNKGSLDSVIRQTHKILGISNSRQDQFEKDGLNYSYTRNGVPLVELSDAAKGIGDIQLIATWQAVDYRATSKHYLSTVASVKIPSGDSSTLLGSGGTDIALALAYTSPSILSKPHLSAVANAGFIHLGKSELMRDIQREYANFANFTLIWHFNQQLSFKSQLDYHSAIYNSTLNQLGTESIKLDLGGQWNFSSWHAMEMAMAQNLRTDPTPDLGLFIQYKFSF